MMVVLDIVGCVLGLWYLVLEIRGRALMWVVGMVMPIVYGVLLVQKGIYGDAAMEGYYFLAGVYGLLRWCGVIRARGSSEVVIRHLPRSRYIGISLLIVLLWAELYVVLRYVTDSKVPVVDGLTTAMSIVALWLLAEKYIEQWALWIIVDAISVGLYIYKGVPFRAVLYAVYALAGIYGYHAWLKKMSPERYD